MFASEDVVPSDVSKLLIGSTEGIVPEVGGLFWFIFQAYGIGMQELV